MQTNNTTRFEWRKQSKLCTWPNGSKPESIARCTFLNNTLFVSDSDTASGLRAVQHAIATEQEFCVHASDYIPAAAYPDVGKQNHSSSAHAYLQCMSSGSNGRPKCVRRTHASWLASFQITKTLAKVTDSDSYAILGKLSHSLTLYAALEAANLGADIHVLSELRPDHQLDALATLASSILYATPTQLRLLCKHACKNDKPEFNLRYIFCGGGKLDAHTARLISALFPSAITLEFYGATETSFISISDSTTPAGSVGKVYPGVEIHIQQAQPDSQNNVGQIYVESPYLFEEYVQGSTSHASAQWQNKFLSVGEFGYLDANGYLFLAGRESRRINIADQLVYPEEIELVLNEHPAVITGVVVPVPNDQRGHVLVAIVEAGLPLAADPKTRREILSYVRKRVGNLKAPRQLMMTDHLPLLASGKPDIRAVEKIVEKTFTEKNLRAL